METEHGYKYELDQDNEISMEIESSNHEYTMWLTKSDLEAMLKLYEPERNCGNCGNSVDGKPSQARYLNPCVICCRKCLSQWTPINPAETPQPNEKQ